MGLERQERLEELTRSAAIENRLDESLHRFFVRHVGTQPARVNLRFAQRLHHVRGDALEKDRERAVAVGIERPRADERLVEEVLFVPARRLRTFHLGLEPAILRAPLRDGRLPRAGDFRQDVQPRANVLAALAVVRRGRRQRERPPPPALGEPVVDLRRLEAELRRIAADFIHRQQPVVDVQRGVLDAFRRDRTGDLLELSREPRPLLPLFRRVDRRLLQQHALDEVEHERRDGGAVALRARHRFDDVAVVVIGDRLSRHHVRAVDGEARDHFFQRRDEAVEREIPEMTITFRESIELMAERVDVARHRLVQHLLLAAIAELAERQRLAPLADESSVDRFERGLVPAVDEQVVHDRAEFVSGRPRHGPVGRQVLAGAQNLLDDDVEARPVEPLQQRGTLHHGGHGGHGG